MFMNVAELVNVVAAKTGQTKTFTRDFIKDTLETILLEVKRGGRVSIVGFGAFYHVNLKARTGRNPQTGEPVTIPATKVPRFKAGKEFRDQVRDYKKPASHKK
jgi:DNA-binding protein HU-beta